VTPECGARTIDIVLDGARQLGLEISEQRGELFRRYGELLQRANALMNLTAHRTPEAVMRWLVLDSLTVLAALPANFPEEGRSLRVVDIGTGAGIPGIPLKIVRPEWELALVESIAKKAEFLESVVDDLGLSDVIVLNGRAEDLGHEVGWRDGADLVVARAVAGLPTLLELCAPFARSGGLLALPKGAGAHLEISRAAAAARALNLEHVETVTVPESLGLGADRVVVLYRKTAPTPAGYPRRIGLARSRPIGSHRSKLDRAT
jgi:16S rRNA (guanine527-N7)-methyltransferase